MRLDLTLVLYWTSLGISAAAVVLFLWLMRERRDAAGGARDAQETPPPPEAGPRADPESGVASPESGSTN